MAYPYRRRRPSRKRALQRYMAMPVLREPNNNKMFRISDYTEAYWVSQANVLGAQFFYICINSPRQGLKISPTNISANATANPDTWEHFVNEFAAGYAVACRVRLWLQSDAAERVSEAPDIDDTIVAQTICASRTSLATATTAPWSTMRLMPTARTKFMKVSYDELNEVTFDQTFWVKDFYGATSITDAASRFLATTPTANYMQIYERLSIQGANNNVSDFIPAGRIRCITDWFCLGNDQYLDTPIAP